MIVLAALLLTGDVLPTAAEAGLRDAFDEQLRDYPSARFRDVAARASTTPAGDLEVIVCGKSNAQNAMGGYAGWEDFALRGVWKSDGTWQVRPKLTYRQATAGLSEGQLVDAVVSNSGLIALCSDAARASGAAIEFDPSYAD